MRDVLLYKFEMLKNNIYCLKLYNLKFLMSRIYVIINLITNKENYMTYKQKVIEVLEKLGGHAYYEDIYKMFEYLTKEPLAKDWRASVRAVIERYSSDSKVFAGKEDLFYSVEGISKGHWGLRYYEDSENIQYTQEDDEFSEGKYYIKQHLQRERNPKLIYLAKKQFKEKNGKLYCQVCGFDFVKNYGKLGEDFIEAHHIKPVSLMKQNEKTKVEDIVMICSNCHSMIHRRRPWLSYGELKSIINDKL